MQPPTLEETIDKVLGYMMDNGPERGDWAEAMRRGFALGTLMGMIQADGLDLAKKAIDAKYGVREVIPE